VRGDALPAPIAKLPIIGVAASTLATVSLLVAGARVDDGEVAKYADHDVVLADVLDRRAAADLRQKGLAVDEAAIGVGVEEIGCEVGVKPGNIRFIDGSDVVAVQFLQHDAVLFVVCHGLNSLLLDDASGKVSEDVLTAYCQQNAVSEDWTTGAQAVLMDLNAPECALGALGCHG